VLTGSQLGGAIQARLIKFFKIVVFKGFILRVTSSCGLEGRLDQAEPGFDDTEWLLETPVEQFTEHGMVCRAEFVDPCVEAVYKGFDSGVVGSLAFGEGGAMEEDITELPQCVEGPPNVLDDFDGPGRSQLVSTVELVGCDVEFLHVSPLNGDTAT
jgi:hypothetical protein